MSRAVITLPLSPLKNHEFSRLVSPIIGETLSKELGANFYLALNLLDSFKDRSDNLDSYLDNINKHKINCDLWVDIDHIELLLEKVSLLIKKNFIYEKKVMMYRCDCGIIEVDKNNIKTCNPNNTLYSFNNDQMVCLKCGSVCKLYEEDELVFDFSKVNNFYVKFMPDYLNKDIKSFNKVILPSYTIISRKRDTGIYINYNNHKYNIDIDFLWEVYVSLFDDDEKVILCGNKELYQLYMVSVLEYVLNSHINSIYVGTPIIEGINDCNFSVNNIDDVITKKLIVILNTKWSVKQRKIDYDLVSKLRRMPLDKKFDIYETICYNNCVGNFNKDLAYIFNEQFNFQKVMKKVKERRNV